MGQVHDPKVYVFTSFPEYGDEVTQKISVREPGL